MCKQLLEKSITPSTPLGVTTPTILFHKWSLTAHGKWVNSPKDEVNNPLMAGVDDFISKSKGLVPTLCRQGFSSDARKAGQLVHDNLQQISMNPGDLDYSTELNNPVDSPIKGVSQQLTQSTTPTTPPLGLLMNPGDWINSPDYNGPDNFQNIRVNDSSSNNSNNFLTSRFFLTTPGDQVSSSGSEITPTTLCRQIFLNGPRKPSNNPTILL